MTDKTGPHSRTTGLVKGGDTEASGGAAGGQQRIESREALGQRLANAHAALELAGVGCWDWEVGTTQVAWTATMEKLWGFAPGEFDGSLDAVAGRISDEDLQRWQESVKATFEEGKEHHIEMRLNLPDGSRRWVEVLGNIVHDSSSGSARMMGACQDITERKLVELALRESEASKQAMLAAMPDFIFRIDRNGIHADYFVPETEQTFSQPEAIIGHSVRDLLPEAVANLYMQNIAQALLEGRPQRFDYSLVFAPGDSRDFEARMVPCGEHEVLVLVRNVTDFRRADAERASLQLQLAHSQKMDSIGRLAGGVAHDFNNLLQAILGHAELMQQKLPPYSPLTEHLDQILRTAQRSADLTRQLLAFASKQTVQPRLLYVNEIVGNTLSMLARLIGEQIKVSWEPGQALPPVRIDPVQMEQMVTNVILNARDAIVGHGSISVATDVVVVPEQSDGARPDMRPGAYVRLCVHDDGSGMTPEVLERVFEPFFTTKDVGKGTGLGLAMVYGAVHQNDGFIVIDSIPGKGTQVAIHLPASSAVDTARTSAADEQQWQLRRQATILVVEDEPAILAIADAFLRHLGCRVLTAGSPGAALAIWNNSRDSIELVLTDVIMPEMNGQELTSLLRAGKPELKCVFMSGYPADVVAERGLLAPEVNFIHKPFTMRTLGNCVARLLEE